MFELRVDFIKSENSIFEKPHKFEKPTIKLH